MTGQVGLDKRQLLQRVVQLAQANGQELVLCNVGQMMYAEAPDVVPGRILDLPLGRLNSLRRAVFKDILHIARRSRYLLVNTHATFRWKHGLFPAFDHDQMSQLDADLYVTLVDNVDAVHARLQRDHAIGHRLKDLLVWREEEMLATEVLARAIRGHGCFYVLARGQEARTAESLYRLIFQPHRKKVYPSFPMSYVLDRPDVLAEIEQFRDILAEHFITFDPADLDEKRLLAEAAAAARRGQQRFSLQVHGRDVSFDVSEVLSLAGDIDGQIYARDFKLIEQADMIVSYIPATPSGRPSPSSGLERELQHAFEATKEVYVIWRPTSEPSPFITETATRIFADLPEAMRYFQQTGYIGDVQLPLARPST